MNAYSPPSDRIKALVGRKFGVTKAEIDGRDLHKTVVEARHVAMWLCVTVGGLTTTLIGRRFGGRDHTTVLGALRSVEKRMARDVDFRETVAVLAEHARRESALSGDIVAHIDTIADKVQRAVRERLQEIASRDPRDLAMQLVPELFRDKED